MEAGHTESVIELYGGSQLKISAGPTPLYNLVFFELDFRDGTRPLAFVAEPPDAALAIEGIEDTLELISDPPDSEVMGFDHGAARRVLDAGRKLRRAIAGAAS